MPALNTRKQKHNRTRASAAKGPVSLFNFPGSVGARVHDAARAALKKAGRKPGEISLILLDDAPMRGLNKRYLKKNRKTDVITFRYSAAPLDGDIFLSKGVSKRQAREQRHSWGDELAYLAIHGILHLLGYTDYTPANKRKMFKIQDRIFRSLSLRGAR